MNYHNPILMDYPEKAGVISHFKSIKQLSFANYEFSLGVSTTNN